MFPASTASFSITSELPSRLTFDSCITRVRRVDSVCRVGTGSPLQTSLERLRHESEIPGTLYVNRDLIDTPASVKGAAIRNRSDLI